MNECHKEPQWQRVLAWLTDNPGRELSQAMTNQWRPPVYRLGAVIWNLRHKHGIDIVKRVEDSKAHYRLPDKVGTVTQQGLPFPTDNKQVAECLMDIATLMRRQAESLSQLARVVEGLGEEPSR